VYTLQNKIKKRKTKNNKKKQQKTTKKTKTLFRLLEGISR